MRILDEETDNVINILMLLLKLDEAKELRDSLNNLIAEKDNKVLHAHIDDTDFLHEITISLYEDSKVNHFTKRIQRLIVDDK